MPSTHRKLYIAVFRPLTLRPNYAPLTAYSRLWRQIPVNNVTVKVLLFFGRLKFICYTENIFLGYLTLTAMVYHPPVC